jgi:hypothetical protein
LATLRNGEIDVMLRQSGRTVSSEHREVRCQEQT